MDKKEFAAYQAEITGAYVRVFQSEDGKVVLDDLMRSFVEMNMCGRNEFETITRAAKRDVVSHIITILKGAEDD